MTVSNEPTTPLQRTASHQPQTFTAELGEVRRGPLRTTRDVLACIRDVLLIIVLAAMLIFGGALVKGLSDVNTDLNTPDVGSTECIGEEPC